MTFTGYFEHSIDAKNRLAIPAKFRSKLEAAGEGNTLVIVPGDPDGRLFVYPERHFDGMSAVGESAIIPDRDQLRFDQMYFPMAEVVELDGQGRVLLPERLIRRAGLDRDVVICGVRDHIEIRRRDTFETDLEADWERRDELRQRAQEAYHRRQEST